MKTKALLFASIMIVGTVVSTADLHGQQVVGECSQGLFCPKLKVRKHQPLPVRGTRMMLSVGHPHPVYAHSRAGINATRTHRWNQSQAQQHSWHGGYYYPAYGQPLALVVPPTASFQSKYSWGVGNTQSVPIYHQYGRSYPGQAAGATPNMYQKVPAQPWNTDQFGIYYSRAPW